MTIAYSGDSITFPDNSVQATAPSGFGFKNRIINGACVIDQRNAGASYSLTPTDALYTLDRWQAVFSQGTKYTVQQNAGSVTSPVGFTNYLGCTSTSAYSVVAGDYFFINQLIEGFNVADLGWGTANAQTVTLSFKVYSSLTGTFGGALTNSAQNRSYPFTYSIAVANTWTTISVTIAGDTSGTWLTTNGTGMRVRFGLGVGSTYSAAANSWAAGNYMSATGAVSVVGTSGATFYITGVQLEKGSTATSFDYRPYGTELAQCQRYFVKFGGNTAEEYVTQYGMTYIATLNYATSALPVNMRASPTVSGSGVRWSWQANLATITSIIMDKASPQIPGVQYITAGGETSFRPGVVTTSSTASYIFFSAEL